MNLTKNFSTLQVDGPNTLFSRVFKSSLSEDVLTKKLSVFYFFLNLSQRSNIVSIKSIDYVKEIKGKRIQPKFIRIRNYQ